MNAIHEVQHGPIVPADVLQDCIASGARSVLLHADAVDEQFSQLQSRIAGDLLHELGKYDIPLAGVVGDLDARPEHFREFVGESNRAGSARWFETPEEAAAWLQSLVEVQAGGAR